MTVLKYSVATILISVPAIAQTNGTYLLTSSSAVSPSSPTTTIGIWATWADPGVQFLFRGADYDLRAGEGVFSNAANVLNGPASSTGIITGNVITGGANGQIHLPPFGTASEDNPILLATYDWSTTDFSSRTVNVSTSNTANFLVAWISNGKVVSLFPDEFTPGSGVINVVPAPAAWIALALPLVAGRRRRC